jgi:hypothetical protein
MELVELAERSSAGTPVIGQSEAGTETKSKTETKAKAIPDCVRKSGQPCSIRETRDEYRRDHVACRMLPAHCPRP